MEFISYCIDLLQDNWTRETPFMHCYRLVDFADVFGESNIEKVMTTEGTTLWLTEDEYGQSTQVLRVKRDLASLIEA